ncbi:hypothetical protein SDC9_99408 [bioreactor metagenome]|uniref:Uncharacterized protein n=1 Tax=bioreactor metagenome TaxID=1076179 RepID=A0A645AIU5_9ZZZZ
MERTLLKELTDPRLKAYLDARQVAPRYWPTLFPLDFSDELDWKALNAENGGTIVADVVSYDSAAPEKGRKVIGKATGEIAKVSVKRTMRERDFLQYGRLKKATQTDDVKKKILDLVYNDVDFVQDAVLGRHESLALQMSSTGRVTLNKQNNNGIVTETDVDMGVPSKNKLTVSKLLDNPEFDFFAEVRTVVAKSKKTGRVRYIWMDEDTFAVIMETPKVKASYGLEYYKNQNSYEGIIDQEMINAYLKKKKLPEIIVIDDADLIFEDDDHARTELPAWEKGYITFTIDKTFGRTQHGPIAEEEAESVKKYAIQAKKGHVLITKWSDVDPVCEKTKGEGHFWPVIDSPDRVYMLNTNSTSKFI